MYRLICVETDFKFKGLEPGGIYFIHAIHEDNSLGIEIDNKIYPLSLDFDQLSHRKNIEFQGSCFDLLKEDNLKIKDIKEADLLAVGQDIHEDYYPYKLWLEKGHLFEVVELDHLNKNVSLSSITDELDSSFNEWSFDSNFLEIYFKKV